MIKILSILFSLGHSEMISTVPSMYHYDTVTTQKPNPGWNENFETVNQTCAADSLFNEKECVTSCDDTFHACLRLCDYERYLEIIKLFIFN